MFKTRSFALAGALALSVAALSTAAMAQSAGGNGGGGGGGGGAGGDIQLSLDAPVTHAVPGGQTHGRGGAAPQARIISGPCLFDPDGRPLRCEFRGYRR
ncbi:MAG: hypothetical protein ACK4M0_10510 [Phreatobacter sp.]